MKRHKDLACITGGTSGIGSAFAMELATRGFDLIITGQDKTLLEFLKQSIEKKYHVQVRGIVVELTNEKHLAELLKLVKKEPITLLVNNAGFGLGKKFHTTDLQRQVDMITVHDYVTTKLCHVVIPTMIKQKRGAIINLSSLAAFFPAPRSAVYNASKAYLKSFSESLFIELKEYGIKVQALCPGFTETNFFKGKESIISPTKKQWYVPWMTANAVVQESLKALKKNKAICIPGRRNRCMLRFSRLIPRRFIYSILRYFDKN